MVVVLFPQLFWVFIQIPVAITITLRNNLMEPGILPLYCPLLPLVIHNIISIIYE